MRRVRIRIRIRSCIAATAMHSAAIVGQNLGGHLIASTPAVHVQNPQGLLQFQRGLECQHGGEGCPPTQARPWQVQSKPNWAQPARAWLMASAHGLTLAGHDLAIPQAWYRAHEPPNPEIRKNCEKNAKFPNTKEIPRKCKDGTFWAIFPFFPLFIFAGPKLGCGILRLFRKFLCLSFPGFMRFLCSASGLRDHNHGRAVAICRWCPPSRCKARCD